MTIYDPLVLREHCRVLGIGYSSPEMREAAMAWQEGGTLMLGAWAARNIKPLTVQKYGYLVEAVREYLGDDTDYSLQ